MGAGARVRVTPVMEGGDRFRGRAPAGRDYRTGGAGRRGGGGPSVSPGSVAPGERLAALAAVALALLMLLDWFGGRSAWQLRLIDVVLLGIALLAVGLAVAGAAGRRPEGRETAGLALTVGGGVAVGAVLTLVLESSGGTVPLVLSLLAALGILGGGVVELRQASPPAGRHSGGRTGVGSSSVRRGSARGSAAREGAGRPSPPPSGRQGPRAVPDQEPPERTPPPS